MIFYNDSRWDRLTGFVVNGTIDNNPAKTHTDASSNTGLVYGDYYLIEAQNRLIGMGLL